MDGRDIGTVVMPDAELKFFMTASIDPRQVPLRRVDQTWAHDLHGRDDAAQQPLERDRLDSSREIGPLQQAEDAIVIDNSELTHREQFQFLLAMRAKRCMLDEERWPHRLDGCSLWQSAFSRGSTTSIPKRSLIFSTRHTRLMQTQDWPRDVLDSLIYALRDEMERWQIISWAASSPCKAHPRLTRA